MSKHTPGPWRCEFDAPAGDISIMGPDYPEMDGRIGVLNTYRNNGQDWRANGDLIAEAPAMRDLLTKLWRHGNDQSAIPTRGMYTSRAEHFPEDALNEIERILRATGGLP